MNKKYTIKIKNAIINYSVLLILLFTSCDGFHEQIVPLNLEVENVSTILVINGLIEKDNFAIVQISYSEDIDASIDAPRRYEENAFVKISTGSGISEQLTYFKNGWYYGVDIKGEEGQTYIMEIDIDGQNYIASSTMFDDPGFKDAWLEEKESKEGKDGSNPFISYSENWRVNDPSEDRNRYLFEWWTNGYHRVYKDWAIDDNRVVNAEESLRLSNPTIDPRSNQYTMLRVAEIDKVTYDYFNIYEKIVRGIIGVASQTPYNPVSNFGQNTMGNFRAVSFSAAIFLTPPVLSAKGADTQIELSWEGNEFFKAYNLYWDTKSGVDENSNMIKDIAAPVDNKPGNYIHKSLTKGTIYYYRIQSSDAEGNLSPLSSEISVIADGDVGPASNLFNNVKATPGSGQIILSWDAIEGAAKYYIYWGTKSGVNKNSQLIYEDGLASPYTHSGLTSGQTYYYRIATNINNKEYLSDEISAMAN